MKSFFNKEGKAIVGVKISKKREGSNCVVENETKIVKIDVFKIAKQFLRLCQESNCSGETSIEAEQVFCRECGKPQKGGDTIIDEACSVLS